MSAATCLLLQPRPLPRAMPSPRACVVLASCPPPQGLRNALWRRASASELSPAYRAPRCVLWLATRSAVRPASSRRVRAVEVRTPLSNPICLVSHLVAQASAGAPAGTPVTVWVKRMDVAGARYVAVKGVDLQETVDDFTARWVVDEGLTVRPSLVTLRLVACGSRKPSEAEEAAAVVLDDPRLTLAAAGVTNGCSLLAFVESSALPHVRLCLRLNASLPRFTSLFGLGRCMLAGAPRLRSRRAAEDRVRRSTHRSIRPNADCAALCDFAAAPLLAVLYTPPLSS